MMAIVIDAADAAAAAGVGAVFDPDTGGALTFRVGCSATGTAPATHYVASSAIQTDYVDALLDPDVSALYAGLQQLAAARGRTLPLTLADAQALRDRMIINPGDAHSLLAAQGLQIIQPPDEP